MWPGHGHLLRPTTFNNVTPKGGIGSAQSPITSENQYLGRGNTKSPNKFTSMLPVDTPYGSKASKPSGSEHQQVLANQQPNTTKAFRRRRGWHKVWTEPLMKSRTFIII